MNLSVFIRALQLLYFHKGINSNQTKPQAQIKSNIMTTKPKLQKPPIDDFNGYYQFLNNDFPAWVEYEGIQFPNVSTAFQAARTSDVQLRKKISQIQNYEDFKSLVASIKNPDGWMQNRYKVMEKLVRDKFKRNKQIANKLASTEQRKLYNLYKTAGDNQMYWGVQKQVSSSGVVEYKGANSLGKILEAVRSDIMKMQDTQKWIMSQDLQQDEELYPQVSLTVIKEGQAIDKLLVQKRNYFLFGSHPKIHFKLDHPSISKFHTAIYFSQLQVVIVDTNSTHGTFVQKKGESDKTKLEPLQKRTLQNGDIIHFGMSSRSYMCNINMQKVEQALKRKEQQIEKNVKELKDVNSISSAMDRDQIKSKIGYKKYEGIHVQNINRNYSYNDIKELFQKYGPIEKIRMVQNYKNGRFEGQVVILYDYKVKIEDVMKEIKRAGDKEIEKMELRPVDQYDLDKIFAKNRQNRDNLQRHRDERDRKRSRSRDHERRDKHKKQDKQDRSYDDRRDK